MAASDSWIVLPTVESTGRHVRTHRHRIPRADLSVTVLLGVVAVFRVMSLASRGEPAGVDFGNWLMLGHAQLGSPLPHAAHVVYPPLVPVLSVVLTNLFGVVWGSAVLLGVAGVAPGIGLYLAARWNQVSGAAVAPAVLVAATSSTGEAVAWGGAPQTIGLGCAAVVLGLAIRLLGDRCLVNATWLAVALFVLAATSHLVLAQSLLTLVLLVPLVWLAAGRKLFGVGTWLGRNGWLACGVIIVAPLVVFIPLYLDLAANAGATFVSAESSDSLWASLGDLFTNLNVVDREMPWFWRPALILAVAVPIGAALTRWRRHPLWAPTAAATGAVVIQAIASSEDRLVYLAPIAVGFALILVIDVAYRSGDRTTSGRRVRFVGIGALVAAMTVTSVAGLARFSTQRDFYGRVTRAGTTEGLDWIRTNTPKDSVMLVAPVNGAPFGWWVQGYARRSAYVGSEDRWLNFASERRRAQNAIAVLSTDDLFGPKVRDRLEALGVDYVVLPRNWGGVSRERIEFLRRVRPEAVPYDGPGLTVIDPSELGAG